MALPDSLERPSKARAAEAWDNLNGLYGQLLGTADEQRDADGGEGSACHKKPNSETNEIRPGVGAVMAVRIVVVSRIRRIASLAKTREDERRGSEEERHTPNDRKTDPGVPHSRG